MNITLTMRLLGAAGVLAVAQQAAAESIASSASSAGSASSGSVSDSLAGSSNSSNNGRRVADGDYRIIQIAATPGRQDRTRVTMQADGPEQRVVLDLPQATLAQQQLAVGDALYARNRVYGIEFGRAGQRQPFYLVLADDWHGELAARPLSL